MKHEACAPSLDARLHDQLGVEHLPDVGVYLQVTTGWRALSLDGETLEAHGPKRTLGARGDDLPRKMMVETELRLGVYDGRWLGAFEFGVGLAEWISGQPRLHRDIVVRPSGSVLTLHGAVAFGGRAVVGGIGMRAEAILGAEVIRVGMDRPGHPETSVVSIETVRILAAPRVTLERRFAATSIGMFVQTNVAAPANVTVGLSITAWL